MITIEAFDSLDRFRELAGCWDGLLSRSDNDTPFMSFEWFSFFWPRFCRTVQPLVLLIKDGAEPVALVPLMRKKMRWRGLPVVNLSFMANYFSIRTGIIAADTADNLFEPVFRFLKERRLGFDLFTADMVTRDSITDRMLRRYCQQRELDFKIMGADSNPFIRVTGTWDEFLMTRSKHQRFNVRHLNKQYARVRHDVTMCTSEGLEEAAEKMFFVSRNSWKFREGTAICNDPVKMDFYRGFLPVAAAAGWLRLKILGIEGTPAAFSYELRHRDRLYILKIGYNDAFKKLTPGAYLVNGSIREAFETGCVECELLGAREEWKLKMCDQCREQVKYWIFNDTPYGKILHAWENRVVAAAKYVAGRNRTPAGSPMQPAGGKA